MHIDVCYVYNVYKLSNIQREKYQNLSISDQRICNYKIKAISSSVTCKNVLMSNLNHNERNEN